MSYPGNFTHRSHPHKLERSMQLRPLRNRKESFNAEELMDQMSSPIPETIQEGTPRQLPELESKPPLSERRADLVRMPNGRLVVRRSASCEPTLLDRTPRVAQSLSNKPSPRDAAVSRSIPNPVKLREPSFHHPRPTAKSLFPDRKDQEMVRLLENDGFDRCTAVDHPEGSWRAVQGMDGEELKALAPPLRRTFLDNCIEDWRKQENMEKVAKYHSPLLRQEMKLQEVINNTAPITGTTGSNPGRVSAAFELLAACRTSMPHLHHIFELLYTEFHLAVYPVQRIRDNSVHRPGRGTFHETAANGSDERQQDVNKHQQHASGAVTDRPAGKKWGGVVGTLNASKAFKGALVKAQTPVPFFEHFSRMEERLNNLKKAMMEMHEKHQTFVKSTEPKKVNAIKAQMNLHVLLCGFTFNAWKKETRDRKRLRYLSDVVRQERLENLIRNCLHAWLKSKWISRRKRQDTRQIAFLWRRKQISKYFYGWRQDTMNERMARVKRALHETQEAKVISGKQPIFQEGVPSVADAPHMLEKVLAKGGTEAAILLQQMPDSVANQMVGAMSTLNSLSTSLKDRDPQQAAATLKVLDPVQAAHLLVTMDPLDRAADIILAFNPRSIVKSLVAAMGPIKASRIFQLFLPAQLVQLVQELELADAAAMAVHLPFESRLPLMKGLPPEKLASMFTFINTSDSAQLFALMSSQEREDVLTFMPPSLQDTLRQSLHQLAVLRWHKGTFSAQMEAQGGTSSFFGLVRTKRRATRQTEFIDAQEAHEGGRTSDHCEEASKQYAQKVHIEVAPVLQATLDALKILAGPEPRVLLTRDEGWEKLSLSSWLKRWVNHQIMTGGSPTGPGGMVIKPQLDDLTSLKTPTYFQQIYSALFTALKFQKNKSEQHRRFLHVQIFLPENMNINSAVQTLINDYNFAPDLLDADVFEEQEYFMAINFVVLSYLFTQCPFLKPRPGGPIESMSEEVEQLEKDEKSSKKVLPLSRIKEQMLDFAQHTAHLRTASNLYTKICARLNSVASKILVMMSSEVEAGMLEKNVEVLLNEELFPSTH